MPPADTVPTATFTDWCDFAREENEYVPPDRTRSHTSAPSNARGDRPGDDFNRRADWAEVLTPFGWRVCRVAGAVTHWTRPGKEPRDGSSATTGRCASDASGDLLYVFSSSAAPFEPDAAYSKFSAYSLLAHGGDYAAAARDLAGKGYGRTDPADAVFGESFRRETPADGPSAGPPDDGVTPDHDFATNEDLKRLDLGLRWVWDGWLQVGTVNLLAAQGGLGKTRFVADLCRRVHLGLPWPDGTPTPACPGQWLAMWVAGDRNHGELLTLSEAFGFGDRISYSGSKAEPLTGVTLNTPSDFGVLYRRVKAAKPLFLVIDTAGGATGFNLSKQEEARSFFTPLSDMAARLGVCVIVITHVSANKTVLGKRAEERVRCVIRMTAEDRKPETVRRVEVVKSNSLFPDPLGMVLGTVGNEYTKDAPPPPEDQGGGGGKATWGDGGDKDGQSGTKVEQCRDWLKAVLADQPRFVHELRDEAEAKGWSVKAMYSAKDLLRLIETEAGGRKVWGLRKI